MNFGSIGAAVRRVGAIVAFGIFLVAALAVPVFAETEGPVPTDPQALAEDVAVPTEAPAPASLPDEGIFSAAMVKEYEAYQTELAQREAELQSPELISERESSKRAYEDATPEQVEELIRRLFGDVLGDLNHDPARFLSDAKIERVAEADAATVTSDGESQLFEAGIPVRAEDEDGNLSKVDVSLERTAEGWKATNPLVDLEVADSAEDGIEVGEEGIALNQAGAAGGSARLVGDKNVLFSDVEAGKSIDMMVSPTSGGVEIFDLLRSIDSPESLRFQFELPAGSQLRPIAGGGAEIVDSEGKSSMLIPAPWARDAQGTTVPVTTQVQGNQLVLEVSHREADFAYPIVVDPTIYQDWGWWYQGQHGSGLSAWSWSQSSGNSWVNHGYTESMWPGYTGLAIASAPGSLPANQWGQWSYAAPNSGTYLADATINPFFRSNRSCSAGMFPQPYDYVGMWNETSWNRILYNNANSQGWSQPESWGRALIIGMGTNGGTYIPCWRDLLVGGVGIWLDDWQYPYLDSVGPTPEGWVKKDGTPRSFSVSASDAGLGVQNVRMFGVGTQDWWLHNPGAQCAGTYESRCPDTDGGQITFTTNGFPYEGRYNGEGVERKFSVQVIDPTDKRWKLERPLWLDGTAPGVSLSSQLATITDQVGSSEKPQNGPSDDDELSLPTYKLQIAADDGADRSGTKEIKVYLDKDPSKEPSAAPTATKSAGSCPTAGCARTLNMEYTLRLPGLDGGKHSLWIVAVDKAGNQSPLNRNIEFEYIPATGMKDEFVMQHFRLPDGNDYSGEAEYHGPEIAVNVINGNVVFHQRDVEVNTDRAELELERVYNSQQPTKQDTQWGRGWEISQAPVFEPEPEQTPAQTATMQRRGEITNGVSVPTSTGQETYSAKLGATVTKTSGGYEVEPEGADEATTFDSVGRIQQVMLGDDTPVYLGPRTEEDLELLASSPPAYSSSFGTSGSEAGQLAHPGDVAVDNQGSLWIADMNNNRIQKFNSNGEFLMQFGSYGTANGQLKRPAGVAIDPKGNVWVADANNNRIQKFTASGEYLAKIGGWGAGNGQFKGPEGIDVDSEGNVWVADTANGRVQVLDENAGFVKTISSQGSEPGQLGEPSRIDIGPGGKVWVTDWQNSRVVAFSQAGQFLMQFGSYGSADGEFKHADGLAVDGQGNVWVSDEYNHRVQRFNEDGEYLTQFGLKGTGDGEFNFSSPVGIALDPKGGLWITDADNDRVQHWKSASIAPGDDEKVPAPYFDPPVIDYQYENGNLETMQLEDEATEGSDPELDLVLSADKVTEAASEEAGDTTYAYGGARMTTADSPDGETNYTYDSSERLASVQLPNGTTATMTYDSTSRATSVKVDPAGPETAKTTNFSYQAEPRRTIVWGGGVAETTYDIGEDGSVLKWAWAETPPTIASISGSIWSKKGQELDNKDQTLFVTGSSPHQIASIKVVVNGDSVVEEKTCEDPASPPSHVCDQPPPLEWITHPSEHAAGRMDVEVIVEDFLGHQAAERFFVMVPQQPPADPILGERPNFKAIKAFRDNHGLDRNSPRTEAQMNELILELLYEWEGRNPTAMSAVENFGSPMRAPELSEMKYRRQYVNNAAQVIPEWAEEHAPTLYGGSFVDDRAGGLIYVGFTQNQAALVDALKDDPRLINPGAIREFPTPPAAPIASLETSSESVVAALDGDSAMAQLTTSVHVSSQGQMIEVGSTDPTAVQQFLTATFGAGIPITVRQEAKYENFSSRYGTSGPIVGGAGLYGAGGICTAGYGSRAQSGESQGKPLYTYFMTTAGHCFDLQDKVHREERKFASGPEIGVVRRDAAPTGQRHVTDALAIKIDASLRSHSVLNGAPLEAQPIQGVQRIRKNEEVCWSGIFIGKECGTVLFAATGFVGGEKKSLFIAEGWSIEGDSGGPVWDPNTHKAVGIISGGLSAVEVSCYYTSFNAKACPGTSITPIVQGGGSDGVNAVLGVETLKQG